jgi:hypothetical protein
LIKLASALAGTGDVDRAERMALYLGEPGQRAQTLADISVTLAPIDGRRAWTIARSITVPDHSARARARIACVHATAGEIEKGPNLPERGSAAALSVSDPEQRSRALAHVAPAAAACSDLDTATTIIASISRLHWRGPGARRDGSHVEPQTARRLLADALQLGDGNHAGPSSQRSIRQY